MNEDDGKKQKHKIYYKSFVSLIIDEKQMKLTRSLNLFINCITPIIWPREFLIAILNIDLCLKL